MSNLRLNVWSGPRNISTALMYSFAQRDDTSVVDEPLYAHYLSTTDADEYHPLAQEVLKTQSADYAEVLEQIMLGDSQTPICFFKQMTHHLAQMPWDFLQQMTNVILIRDPVEMLPSYAKQVTAPSMRDVGYEDNIKLYEHLISIGQTPPILDAKRVLLDPEGTLSTLCSVLDIPFQEKMLSWEPGARPEDGAWAPAWYDSVHRSTGFMTYKPKSDPFPDKLKPLLEECLPLYQRLSKLAI